MIVLAADLLAEVTVREPDPEAVGVDEASARNLDDGAARGRAAAGLHSEHANGRVEDNRVLIREDVRENAVLRVRLDHNGHVHLGHIVSHPDVALAPGVGSSCRVDRVGGVLRALHLDDRLQLVTTGCVLNDFRGVSSFEVALAQLSIDIEAPCEEDSLVGECSNVPEAGSTLDEILAELTLNLNLLRKLEESVVLNSELPESGFSPTPDVTVSSDSKGEEGSASYVVDWAAIERLYVLWGTRNLDALADSKLSFKASSPGVNVGLVSKYEGVMFTTGNLNYPFVSQRLQNSGSELAASPAMANCALDA